MSVMSCAYHAWGEDILMCRICVSISVCSVRCISIRSILYFIVYAVPPPTEPIQNTRSRLPESSAKATSASTWSETTAARRYCEADGARANAKGVGGRANNRRGASWAQRTGAARNGAAMVGRRRSGDRSPVFTDTVVRQSVPSGTGDRECSHRPLPSPRYTAVASLQPSSLMQPCPCRL